jgi:hypothetical protein
MASGLSAFPDIPAGGLNTNPNRNRILLVPADHLIVNNPLFVDMFTAK